MMLHMKTTATRNQSELSMNPPKKRKAAKYDNLSGYLFISPFLIGFFTLTIIPILASLFLSFTNFDMLGTPKWIGTANFHRMVFEDDKFWKSLQVTFYYVVTAVPLRLIFALAVAMVLAKALSYIGVYRTLLYLPSIIGGSVSIAVMWKQLFGSDGAVNSILAVFGIHKIEWLGDPSTALWTLIVLYGWQFGSSMLIFLAGLKNIPRDYYEAAMVDGANVWQKFIGITIPLLTPVILFNLVMQMIHGFMAFTPSFIISDGQGSPLDSTLLYVLYMFRRAFVFFDMGYASAMAWVMLLIIGFFTAIIFRSSSYWVHYESEGDK